MCAHLLLYVVLIDPSVAAGSPAEGIAAAPWTTDQLRIAFDDITLRTARKREIEPFDVAPDLIVLYTALYDEIEIPGAELVSMRRRTKARLEDAREILSRERLRLDRQAQREKRRNLSQARRDAASTFGGGAASLQAERAQAQELIDLITATIEPQSWQDAGGRGAITYYQPLKVLVIRNSQRVHEQIGGLLD
ncbi:MAG: hypothetical protein DWQ45_01105 [Planctomycetota bacterium]|mgnify:CR=1 FL=1|nr:MAG: hypothetical protein DWQ41_20990 [Planctomycetota bacterium]REK39897.1 MAG: hypothetical protein DWQ45_01105 [Planctomycetota bacterium]